MQCLSPIGGSFSFIDVGSVSQPTWPFIFDQARAVLHPAAHVPPFWPYTPMIHPNGHKQAS